jgi:hypothetical protein
MFSYNNFVENNKVDCLFNLSREKKYWKDIFKRVKENQINTWDYQWTYSIWTNGGLSILPNQNLIKNIGFDSQGTHTNNDGNVFSKMKSTEISQSIKHPQIMIKDNEADTFAFNRYFYPKLLNIVINKLKK